ncbi:MAG: helix-turn-helix domain-containing protein [Paludibacter sp.]|jgi:AraC-like DNA-binding protein|nr:helix-turn-helix domain-containing protein [Paludibacter sp.]
MPYFDINKNVNVKTAKLLYANEHIHCQYYDNSKEARIEKLVLADGEQWNTTPAINHIFVIYKGSIRFSFGYYVNQCCSENHFFFLPATQHIHIYAEENSQLIIFRLYNKIQFCDQYRLENLKKQVVDNRIIRCKTAPYLLEINDIMLLYIKQLERCLEEGLKCKYYLEGKIKELFFILRAFYLKEDLIVSFHDTLSEDNNFSNFVICNHNKYNLNELAAAMNYSGSGFYRRFKQTFGMTPSKWITEQKAKEVYHRICTDDVCFKELSDELGFSSLSHFYGFVKNNFGQTPGEIRKIHEIAGNME